MNTLELLDKKEQLKQRAEEIVSKAEKETRRLNEGEHAEFNSITVELEDIDKEIRKIASETKLTNTNNTSMKKEKFSLLKAINDVANSRQLDERAQEVVSAGIAEFRKSGQNYSGQIVLPIEERAIVQATVEGAGSPYMSASSVQQLLNVTRKLHPLNNLRTGQPYTLVCSPDGRDMERFEYEINDRKKLIVTKTDEGLVAHVEPIVYDFSLVHVSGTIRSSLFETLASTGESPILAVRIADIFGSEINFIKGLREGDSFSLLIEKRFRENEFKGYGKVLGATFTNQGKTYEAYNFATEDGEAFFNAKGESLKKTLLKAPLAFTRISSGYSMNRKHPIFKTHKPHQPIGRYCCFKNHPIRIPQ